MKQGINIISYFNRAITHIEIMDGDHTDYAMGKDLSTFKIKKEEYYKEWCIW